MSGWFAIAEWSSGKSKVMHPYSAAPARDHAVRLQAGYDIMNHVYPE
jgi:hypothetical protein